MAEECVGVVLEHLLPLVKEAGVKAVTFRSLFKDLETTLRAITPTVQEIDKLNRDLDQPEQETKELIDKLREGEQLVRKCSKVKWNVFKRIYYAFKLQQLNSFIVRFIQVNMQAQQTRDDKKILLNLGGIERHLNIGGKFIQVGIRPCSVPDPPEIAPGFDAALKELKTILFNQSMQVIVVSAPGGSGKTTLVKKLCKDDQVRDKFKGNIFFVTVSRTPKVKVIVQKIFQHIHKDNHSVPEFLTNEEAINYLEQLLKEMGSAATLLILDDVWSGPESIVQKFKFQLPNYKLLVTSRFVFPEFGSGYNLKPLNDEAAMTLFQYSAIRPDGNSYIPDQDLVNKILRACKGSPLALTVVGRSLCGRPAEVWKKRVKEWTQETNIFHSNTELLVCLQSSLDALDNEMKECYMDLGSFPEDHRIPVTALIDMWTELYELGEDLYAITNLDDLSNQNLVNQVVTRTSGDGFYNDHFVIQHDLLRELIIHQSMLEPIEKMKRLFIDIDGDNFPGWWLEQKLHPRNARLLSITTDETFSSGWYDLKAPEVEVVVLNIRSKKYTLPKFMNEMDKLKVLIVINYGFYPVELSEFQILGYLPNLKRIRLEQVSISSFNMTTIQMKNLLKISVVMSNIGQVFRNPTFQISHAFPNLKEIHIDYCNDIEELPDGVCEIISLKIVSITNSHKLSRLPEGIGKLVNLEVLRLASCTDLAALPDTIGNLSNLNFLDISECLNIKELPIQIGALSSLETLCMRGCSSCELPRSMTNLQNLKEVKCDEETAYNWEQFLPHLSNARMKVLKEDINLNWLHNDHF